MRKLMIFAVGFMLSVLASVYFLSPFHALVCGGVSLILSVLGFFLSGKERCAYFSVLLGLCVGFLYFSVYCTVFISPAEEFNGSEDEVCAVVRSYPKEYNNVYVADIKITDKGPFPISASLAVTDAGFSDVCPGDMIRISAHMVSATNKQLSYGNRLAAYSESFDILGSGNYDLICLGNIASHAVSELTERIFPGDVLPLVKAMIAGDKTDYYESYTLNKAFMKTGLSHIVAISGLHVSFILMLPGFFIKSRKKRAFIAIPLILFFMAFAGFTPSACRAGLFQILLYLSYVLHREPDMPTCLFFAMVIILLFNPYLAERVSLQLSFCAISGIMLVSKTIYERCIGALIKTPRFARAVFTIISTSIGALLFTAPLTAIYFGRISLVAVFTAVLVMWVLGAAFCLCIVSCILGAFSVSVGSFAALLAAYPLRYIQKVAGTVSSFSGAVISMADKLILVWFIITYLIVLCFFATKKHKRIFGALLCFCGMALCVILMVPRAVKMDAGFAATALNVGQGQCIVLTENELTCVVDCGSTSGFESGDVACDYLDSERRDVIDYLIITHWHADHVNGIPDLLITYDVKYAVFPEKSDDAVYDDLIIQAAEDLGIEITYCTTPLELSFGRGKINVYPPTADGDENERCCAVLCSVEDCDTLITGDMPAYCEVQLLERADIPDIELLIVGHHGSYYSTSDALLDETKPETAIISVGQNSYGHPTDVVLDKLAARHIKTFRTDESGNITVPFGG